MGFNPACYCKPLPKRSDAIQTEIVAVLASMPVSRPQRIELNLMLLTVLTVALGAARLPVTASSSTLVLSASVLILAQSLLRDSWLWLRQRHALSPQPTRALACFCLESTLGSMGVALGLSLSLFSPSLPVEMSTASWTALVGISLLLGFLIRDWVITWRPLGLRRETDHFNIIISWRHHA